MQANRSRSRRRARRVVTKVVEVGTNNTIWVIVVSSLCAAVLTAAVVATTVAVSLKNNTATPTTSNTTTAPATETTPTATGTTVTTNTSAALTTTTTMLTTSTAVSTTKSCIIDATSLYAFSSTTDSTLLNGEYSVATNANPKITFANTTFNATLIKFAIGMGNVQAYTATAHPGEQFKQGSPVDNQYTPELLEFSGANITFNSIDFQLTPKVSGRNINIASLFIQVCVLK